MKAPEKLYYAPYGDIRENHPITDNDIEYTSTDAFIEKACKWLEKNIAEATGIDSYAITESFKQAMKGE